MSVFVVTQYASSIDSSADNYAQWIEAHHNLAQHWCAVEGKPAVQPVAVIRRDVSATCPRNAIELFHIWQREGKSEAWLIELFKAQ